MSTDKPVAQDSGSINKTDQLVLPAQESRFKWNALWCAIFIAIYASNLIWVAHHEGPLSSSIVIGETIRFLIIAIVVRVLNQTIKPIRLSQKGENIKFFYCVQTLPFLDLELRSIIIPKSDIKFKWRFGLLVIDQGFLKTNIIIGSGERATAAISWFLSHDIQVQDRATSTDPKHA